MQRFSETLRLQKSNMTSTVQNAKEGTAGDESSLHQSVHQSTTGTADKSQQGTPGSRWEGNTQCEMTTEGTDSDRITQGSPHPSGPGMLLLWMW